MLQRQQTKNIISMLTNNETGRSTLAVIYQLFCEIKLIVTRCTMVRNCPAFSDWLSAVSLVVQTNSHVQVLAGSCKQWSGAVNSGQV